MVICEKCFQSYEDDAVPDRCQVCGTVLKKPVAVEAAVANVARLDSPKREPVHQPPPDPVRRESTVRKEEKEKTEEFPVRRLPPPEVPLQERREEIRQTPPAPREAPQTPPAGSLPPSRTPAFRTVEPIAALDPDDKPLDAKYLETISSFDDDEAIVTVIGFSASGKTFFVNRLRNDLAGAWKRKPAPAEEIKVSPEGIELTRFLPTDGKPQAGRNLSYLILDCAGESFQQALRSQGNSSELTGKSVRAYLAALAFASAFILVMKAEDLLAFSAPDRRNESQDEKEQKRFIRKMVADFDDIIHAIVIAKSRLAKQGAQEFLQQGISQEEFKAAFRSQDRCAQPIYIALSLADRLEAMHGETYDMDPFLFALETAPVLFKTIHRSFDSYRFDFLTAFQGHGEDLMDVQDPEERQWRNIHPDYHRKSYGAVEAFEWIHALIREQRSNASPRLRLLSNKMPTRSVVKLRRKFDPAFRKAWGRQ